LVDLAVETAVRPGSDPMPSSRVLSMRRPPALIRRIIAAACLVTAVSTSACGYRPVYGTGTPSRLHVKLVRTLIADAVASDEVTAGLREELARAGALEGGEGFPRVEVEVLRADEASEGIASSATRAAGAVGAPAASAWPRARATDLGITARAWIVRAEGAPPESDTGDLRAEETLGVDVANTGAADPRASAFHDADALRAAARRLGRKLAFRITGEPAASDGVNGP
jgi:hypothetical protein